MYMEFHMYYCVFEAQLNSRVYCYTEKRSFASFRYSMSKVRVELLLEIQRIGIRIQYN